MLIERHKRITQRITKPISQNKIYYGTQLKRTTNFRHPYKNKNGQIITDINHKPTDSQQYLHFKSHNHKNCIESIHYPLARRIHKIIKDKNLKETRLIELRTTLNQGGYPTTLINKGIELAEKYCKEN